MSVLPENTHKAGVYPGSLSDTVFCRSISDDDLCAWCAYLCYRPGELSLYRLADVGGVWPCLSDIDGYAHSCPRLCLLLMPD